MQQILNVVTPATVFGLLSLAEFKAALGITDNSQDAEIAIIIDYVSSELARLANRVFALEEVIETFYDCRGEKRLILSRWPVLPNTEAAPDNIIVTMNGTVLVDPDDYVLEVDTGFLYRPTSSWSGTVMVEYSGGYVLPDDAPLALKQAAILLAREAYYAMVAAAASGGISVGAGGVRLIAHKESRIMYYQATESSSSGGGSGGSFSGTAATRNAVESLLNHYRRPWI